MSDSFDITVASADGTPPAGPNRGGRRWLVAASVAVVAVVGVIAVRPSDPVAEAPEAATPTVVPTAAPAPTEGAQQRSIVPVTPVPDAGGANFPPSDEHLELDQIIHVFDAVLDTDATSYGIAYLFDGELRVADARGVSGTDVEIAHGFPQLTDVHLVSTGTETWAIDELDRNRSYVVSSIYDVVDLDSSGTLGVIRRGASSSVDVLADGLPYVALEIAPTTEVLGVEDFGLLLMPRTGGTYELRPMTREPVQISSDRAIAASRSLIIYETCNVNLECGAYAYDLNNNQVLGLPFPPTSRFWPSPDGEWIVVDGDGFTVRYSLRGETSHRLPENGVDAVDWSHNSAFVGILRGETVEVHIVATGDIEVLELPETPDDGALGIFESQS